MAKITLEEKYKKLGLVKQPQTVLNAMKQLNPQQYERYMKREKLIVSSKYKTHTREIFVKNLLDALETMKQKYGDSPLIDINDIDPIINYNVTIQTLIDDIKKIQFKDWDILSLNMAMFLETYNEDSQEAYDFETMQDMYRQIYDFQQSTYFKKHQRKGQFRYTTLSNKGLGLKYASKTSVTKAKVKLSKSTKTKRKTTKRINASLSIKTKKPKTKDKYN